MSSPERTPKKRTRLSTRRTDDPGPERGRTARRQPLQPLHDNELPDRDAVKLRKPRKRKYNRYVLNPLRILPVPVPYDVCFWDSVLKKDLNFESPADWDEADEGSEEWPSNAEIEAIFRGSR